MILYLEDGTDCLVSGNGVNCAGCGGITCSNSIEGRFFQCSNIPTGDDYSSCDLNFCTDGVLEVFNFDEFDVCLAHKDIQRCSVKFSNCNSFTDCCSGRCVNNQCRSATHFGG